MEIPATEILLADTSFLGHYENARRHPGRYRHWDPDLLGRISEATLAITPFTLAEIRYGYRLKGWQPARVAATENTLASYLLIPLDEKTLDTYVDVKLVCKRSGKTLGFHDCWIAATAVSRRIPLISCDRDHVGIPGLDTIFLSPA